MIVIDCEQRSPEWFAARTGIPTASRFKDARAKLKSGAPAQAQLDYMAELAIERITGNLTDKFVNDAIRRGSDLEDDARSAYEAETGSIVSKLGFVLNDERSFGYSPDGLVGDDGLIEIKCPANPYKLTQLLITGDVSEYMDQCQGGMWITGREWCDLVPYHPSLQLRRIRVVRDEKYIDSLACDMKAFSDRLLAYVEAICE